LGNSPTFAPKKIPIVYRKALIFLGSFVVSIIVTYMVYYYTNIGKYTSGIVARVTDLKNTAMSPYDAADSHKNFIGSRSIANSDSRYSLPPASMCLDYDTTYNRDVLYAVNDEISNEFHGHPPIGFPGVKDGERISFFYIFHRIIEPGFASVDTGLAVDGKRIAYCLVRPGTGVKLFRSGTNGLLYFQVPLKDGGLMVVEQEDAAGHEPQAPLNPENNQSVLMPVLDFNIVKVWDQTDARQYRPDAGKYKYLEDRVKLKVETLAAEKKREKISHAFRPPMRVLFYPANNKKPYLELRLRDTELLLKQRQTKPD
jgi:hypothetical protein